MNEHKSTEKETSQNNSDPWIDDDDRIANFYVTGNLKYDHIPLPKIIKLKNCNPGEVTLMEKCSFPKAARMHKKREDNNPHRFFLSELMLYSSPGYSHIKKRQNSLPYSSTFAN